MENRKKQYLLTRITIHYTMLSMYIMQSQCNITKRMTQTNVFFSRSLNPNCNSTWYACRSWQLWALPWSTNITKYAVRIDVKSWRNRHEINFSRKHLAPTKANSLEQGVDERRGQIDINEIITPCCISGYPQWQIYNTQKSCKIKIAILHVNLD